MPAGVCDLRLALTTRTTRRGSSPGPTAAGPGLGRSPTTGHSGILLVVEAELQPERVEPLLRVTRVAEPERVAGRVVDRAHLGQRGPRWPGAARATSPTQGRATASSPATAEGSRRRFLESLVVAPVAESVYTCAVPDSATPRRPPEGASLASPPCEVLGFEAPERLQGLEGSSVWTSGHTRSAVRRETPTAATARAREWAPGPGVHHPQAPDPMGRSCVVRRGVVSQPSALFIDTH